MVATIQSAESLEAEACRGSEMYDRLVKPKLRPEDDDKYIAVDIDSGEFEIDKDDYVASERLLQRLPESRIWMFRAGWPATCRMRRTGNGGAEC